jgi:acetyltransferase-like isoleucine patch superfamily enzyme
MSEFVPLPNGVRVRITRKFIDYLSDHRIFSHQNRQVMRWTEGEWLSFTKTAEMEPYSAVFRGEFLNSLGAFSFLTLPVIGMFQMQFSTGRYCSIGGGLRIPGNNHPMEALSSSPILYDPVTSWVQAYVEDEGLDDFPYVTRQRGKGAPEVANDVWLGSDVTLNHGVRIGNGAIVAAHSVVTRDVPDYAIVGGNPARVIRYRFPEEIIRELLSIEPWRYSVKDLRQFNLGDMASFIRQFRGAEASLQPWEPPKVPLWPAYRDLHGV